MNWNFQIIDPKWYTDTVQYNNEKEHIIEIELPGIEKEDVKIKTENSTLKIEFKKKHYNKDEKVEYYKKYQLINSEYDLNNINAELKNGILKLILPKKESSYKEIEVK